MNGSYEKLTESLLAVLRNRERKELLGGALSSVCGGCLADADYCARISGADPLLARFYAAAHYCAYVPYGAAGWEYFCRTLEKKGFGAAEYRLRSVSEALGTAGQALSEEDAAELKRFLGALYGKELDLSSAAGCAAAVCTLYHACEAQFGEKGCRDFLELAHRTSDVTEKFFKKLRSDGESAFAEVTGELKPCPALSARRRRILLKVTGVR